MTTATPTNDDEDHHDEEDDDDGGGDDDDFVSRVPTRHRRPGQRRNELVTAILRCVACPLVCVR